MKRGNTQRRNLIVLAHRRLEHILCLTKDFKRSYVVIECENRVCLKVVMRDVQEVVDEGII